MQFDNPNSQSQLNDQTPLTDTVGASLVPFVLATPHHAPADLSHEVQNSRKLTEEQLEAIAGGARGDDGCPIWTCGGNHNETMVSNSILKQERHV